MSRFCAPRERSPPDVAVGELEVARLDRVGHDRLDQPGQQELPASTRLGIVAGQAGHHGRHRRAIAVEHPEDPRGAAGLERQAERLVLVQPGHRRRLGPRAGADGAAGSAAADAAARSSHSATTSRAARQAASALAAPIRAASASRVNRSSVARTCGRGGVLARRDRGRVTRVVVDPVDLGQPVACGRLEGVRIGRGPDGRPEAALGRFLGRVDRARIGPRGRVEGRRLVRVVRALGGAQGFRRGIGLAAGARRELAAFGGQSPLLGAAFGRDRVPGSSAPRSRPGTTPSSARPVRPSCATRADRPARSGCPSGEGRAP